MIVISFCLFLLGFAAIGVLSVLRKKNTSEDYLVAGREINPWLTALSSMATNNSGYAFIGLVGFAYTFGLHSLWLSIAWILGDVLVWMFVHRRVRVHAEEVTALSVPTLLGSAGKGRQYRTLVFFSGLLTFVFLGVYAAAQLKAGSTALHSLFGWPMSAGALIGAIIVVIYCFSGGLRASIWTDAAQAVVMSLGMAMILGLAVSQVGGPTGLTRALRDIDPALAHLFPQDLALGFGWYFLGFVAGGFGAIGAPHILIRSMAITKPDDIPRARNLYLATFVPFVLASAIIGLYTRVILPELSVLPASAAGLEPAAPSLILTQQAEQSLPMLAMALLPEVLVGMVLAAIFAATMSTADSQILSCSAALTQDMVPRWQSNYVMGKVATLSVTVLSLLVALFAGKGVFSLVLVAWSALGAGLGPILLLRLARKPIPRWVGIAMIFSGLATVILWELSPWAGDVFKLLPGLVVPLLLYGAASLLGMTEASSPSFSQESRSSQ